MRVIGITGSIGMGKTTISSMLKFFNIPIFDSDKEVKNILECDKTVLFQIQKIWPEVISSELNQEKINKLALADKIFKSKKDRVLLEKIIHPLVKQKRTQFIRNHSNSKFVGLDVPLLYETKTNEICDVVFLVKTSKKIQQKRVLKRANMTKERFELINSAQWNYEKKKKLNPFIIETSFGKFLSFIQVIIYLIIIINRKENSDKRASFRY